jgi:hypothetical protein
MSKTSVELNCNAYAISRSEMRIFVASRGVFTRRHRSPLLFPNQDEGQDIRSCITEILLSAEYGLS